MPQDPWASVDQYFAHLFIPPDPALEQTLRASAAAGLPPIHVSPLQGKLLHLLARLTGARNVLEIGTLGGYSTIWLARALPPGGRVVTLESNPAHAAVARANFAAAGVAHAVHLREGSALQSLAGLRSEGAAPFDLIFIDADKTSYPDYLDWSLRLSRRGTVIIADNVVRNGAVLDAQSTDPNVQAVRRFNDLVAANPRLAATALQTVGAKGYDGFAVVVVTG
jgi:predicted O-methyltransferase YrrM